MLASYWRPATESGILLLQSSRHGGRRSTARSNPISILCKMLHLQISTGGQFPFFFSRRRERAKVISHTRSYYSFPVSALTIILATPVIEQKDTGMEIISKLESLVLLLFLFKLQQQQHRTGNGLGQDPLLLKAKSLSSSVIDLLYSLSNVGIETKICTPHLGLSWHPWSPRIATLESNPSCQAHFACSIAARTSSVKTRCLLDPRHCAQKVAAFHVFVWP